MVFLYAGLIAITILLLPDNTAWARSFCNMTPPIVRVDKHIGPLNVNHGLNKQQIRKLAGAQHQSGPAVVGGIYRPQHSYELKVSANDNRLGDKRCITAREVILKYTVQRDVYIPTNYPRRSCQFRAVYNHEMQHVHFDEQAIRKYMPLFEQSLFRAVQGRTFTNPDQLYARLEASIKGLWGRFNTERQNLHYKIDNKRNYARESQACSTW